MRLPSVVYHEEEAGRVSMRVQRVLAPDWDVESCKVLGDDQMPVEPIEGSEV